jgi:hypothetical protein
MRGLVAVGLLVVPSLLGGCAGAAVTANEPTVSADLPEPPGGMRWVGMKRVVVAVPDGWTTGGTRCGAPVEDTVYFDNGAVYDCADPVPESEIGNVSSLAVLDTTWGYGELVTRTMETVGDVDGREVVELPGCNEWFSGVCRKIFAVPEEGVAFAVVISDPDDADDLDDADYEAVRDSLRILPDGQVTVPLATSRHGYTPTRGDRRPAVEALVGVIEKAGLRAEVVVLERSNEDDLDMLALGQGALLGIDPPLGSVVDEGATVTISVAGPHLRAE